MPKKKIEFGEMGNQIPRTNIFPGDTTVQFVLSSTDGIDAYFSFAFFRNSMESRPAFIMTMGANSNTTITVYKMDEITGRVLETINIANYSIPSANTNYNFDICGQTITVTDLSAPEIVGTYNDIDIRFMMQYMGGGSPGTVVMAAAPMRSTSASCLASASVTPVASISSAPAEGFPWWGILLVVVGGLLVLGLIAWMVWALIAWGKEKPVKTTVQ